MARKRTLVREVRKRICEMRLRGKCAWDCRRLVEKKWLALVVKRKERVWLYGYHNMRIEDVQRAFSL